jgi:hypothetical protein
MSVISIQIHPQITLSTCCDFWQTLEVTRDRTATVSCIESSMPWLLILRFPARSGPC